LHTHTNFNAPPACRAQLLLLRLSLAVAHPPLALDLLSCNEKEGLAVQIAKVGRNGNGRYMPKIRRTMLL
jgi:hypothetical protein